MDIVRRIALALIIIGAINWGLIGFFNFDLVAFIFGGQQSFLSRTIYALVGISGIYALSIFFTGIESAADSTINMNQADYGTEFGDEFNQGMFDEDQEDEEGQ